MSTRTGSSRAMSTPTRTAMSPTARLEAMPMTSTLHTRSSRNLLRGSAWTRGAAAPLGRGRPPKAASRTEQPSRASSCGEAGDSSTPIAETLDPRGRVRRMLRQRPLA